MEGETHNSVLLAGYYSAFKLLFRPWKNDSINNLTDLERHYSKLSSFYGYTTLIPESEINSLGYKFLFDGKTEQAIAIFQKNLEQYPDDPNVYDSMGGCL